MKKLCKLMKKVLTGFIAVLVTAGTMSQAAFTISAQADDAATYSLSVTMSREEVYVGDKVTFTATLTCNGVEVTELEDGLNLWWWTDIWNNHTDGSSDATYSDVSGKVLTNEVTFNSEGTYYIIAELKDSVSITSVCTTVVVTAKDDSSSESETSTDDSTEETTEENTDSYVLNVSTSTDTVQAGDEVTFTATLTCNGAEVTELEDGLNLWWWTDIWNNHTDGSSDATYSDVSGKVLTNEVTFNSEGTYYIIAELKDSASITSACTTVVVTAKDDSRSESETSTEEGTAETTVTPVSGDLNITVVDGLASDDDFVMGVDISSVISEFESGVVYYDYDGNKIDNVTDFCKFLKSQGITHVRVRVWNDPYDSEGNGYGGGNCDVAKAKQIADACRTAGLKMLVDFHYSDFWADPSKYTVPKAWDSMTLTEKAGALEKFTLDSLNTIDPSKDVVTMVQVGNETTGGIAGENTVANMCTLFSAGAKAVREYNSSVEIVIHVTNPEKSRMTQWAENLASGGVDYDILATSYYPYWHGTLANLQSQMKTVQDTYGKKTMVAETSYAYTLEDSDGHDNTVRTGTNDSSANCTESFTVQGQATSIRNLINAVYQAGGVGVFYWEPAWITVGDTTGLSGDEYTAQVGSNKIKWEKYGSGWAASYGGDYDSDAGDWYGGSAVDNEAMFYPDGTPTAGWHVWKYVLTGAVNSSTYLEEINNAEESVVQGGTYTLPATITLSYSNGDVDETVVWNEPDIDKIDVNVPGTYVVNGTVTVSKDVKAGAYADYATVAATYTLTVKHANLITNADDASFENKGNFSFSSSSININGENVTDGKLSLHWYKLSASDEYCTYNTLIELEPGCYTFEAKAMGAAGDVVSLQILDADGNIVKTGEGTVLTGWSATDWLNVQNDFEITETTSVQLRVLVSMLANGWGGVDEMYLYRTGDIEAADSDDSDSGEKSENSDSETADSETADSEAADSETTDSETADSETTGSETTDSETTDSETADSETTDSETTDSETADSETADSETADSETTGSETTDSDATGSEIAGSETTDSDATDSETADSETTDSETTGSETTDSETTGSETTESEISDSDNSEIKTETETETETESETETKTETETETDSKTENNTETKTDTSNNSDDTAATTNDNTSAGTTVNNANANTNVTSDTSADEAEKNETNVAEKSEVSVTETAENKTETSEAEKAETKDEISVAEKAETNDEISVAATAETNDEAKDETTATETIEIEDEATAKADSIVTDSTVKSSNGFNTWKIILLVVASIAVAGGVAAALFRTLVSKEK